MPGLAPRGLVVACVVVIAFVVVPIVVTIHQAATGDWQQIDESLSSIRVPALILNTLLLACGVTPICGLLGVVAGWLVERTDLPGRRMWALLLIAPLTIPLFVTSYAWSSFGPAFQGLGAAVVITSLSYYAIVYLLVSASLRDMDPALEESARSLGCRTWRVFLRVILPQLRPAILGGVLIVALDTLVEFDAFVGIHFSIFASDIYAQYRIGFSSSGASALACVSIAICVVVLLTEARLRRGAQYTSTSYGARRLAARYELGLTTPFVLIGTGLLVAASVGVPLHSLVSWFSQSTSQDLGGVASSIQLLPAATATSIGLGTLGAVLATALAIPIAVLSTRFQGAWVTLLERATYLSFGLPDLVAAIAIAYAASTYVRPLYGSLGLLVFAYAILFVPISVVALRVAFVHIDPRLEEATRALGLNPLQSFLRVTLPLARPGLAAAGVLVFSFVLSDLSTTQVLLPPGMVTLGTQFWADSSAVAFGAAAPYAAALMTLALGATYVLMSRFGKTRMYETG
jgi:iron(III) transport system permease protein